MLKRRSGHFFVCFLFVYLNDKGLITAKLPDVDLFAGFIPTFCKLSALFWDDCSLLTENNIYLESVETTNKLIFSGIVHIENEVGSLLVFFLRQTFVVCGW